MKIVADENIPFLTDRIPDADLVRIPASAIDRDAVRDADALITRTRTACNASLLKDSRVRLVATATIGTDHIDLAWCAANGITVRNAPGCNAPGVALYVWSSLLRNGFDPRVSTLGVIGCGNVGRIVAQWGERLGAKVLVCDPPRQEAGLSDREYISLEEVMGKSDAITLHTPLTRSGAHPTFHLIDDTSLSDLKKGALFVNAARGEVVDTASLCTAIEDGRIIRSIIDTWEGEPRIDRRLLDLSDVATCHIAGYSVEGKQRATRMALEAIEEVLGLKVDTSGLAPAYKEPSGLSEAAIVSAYDPSSMTAALKSAPDNFEFLRNTYRLHREII